MKGLHLCALGCDCPPIARIREVTSICHKTKRPASGFTKEKSAQEIGEVPKAGFKADLFVLMLCVSRCFSGTCRVNDYLTLGLFPSGISTSSKTVGVQ